MTKDELSAEAWKAWVKDKPLQSEDTAKGFREGFNFCLLGKIRVEGGDKGELISANFLLRDRLMRAEEIISKLLIGCDVRDEAEQFLEEVEA